MSLTHTPHRALLVIDVQNEYVNGALPIAYPPLTESLANIGRAMDAATTAGVPVIVIQQSAPPTSPIFARWSDGWRLHPVVADRPRDELIEKTLPGSFTGTDLERGVHNNGVDTLTIVGYLTHNCIDTTARQALHRGLAVEIVHDAIGTVPLANYAGAVSAEALHRAEMVVMQSRYAAVLSAREWIRSLESAIPARRDTLVDSYRRAVASEGVIYRTPAPVETVRSRTTRSRSSDALGLASDRAASTASADGTT